VNREFTAMASLGRTVLFAGFSLASTACDESLTTPTRTDLSGRWQLASLHLRTDPPITPPSETAVGIEFVDDHVSVQSDCNVCSGRYTLNGASLTLSALACTRRACREGSIEGTYLQILSTASTASGVPGRALKLEGPDGSALFRR
jgi:heat shock protein HslJ